MRFAQIQGNSDNIGELGRDVHAVRNSILEKRKDGTHMNVIAFVGELTELSEIRTSAAGNRFATMMIRVQRPFANSEGVYEYDNLNIMLWKGIAETAMAAADTPNFSASPICDIPGFRFSSINNLCCVGYTPV